MNDDVLAAALRYARNDIPVFPCNPDKTPLGKLAPHGWKDATTDPVTIARWWLAEPHALIGAPVPEGWVCIDYDPRHGAKLTDLQPMPRTREVSSGRGDGGTHFYFERPDGKLSQAALTAHLAAYTGRNKDNLGWDLRDGATHYLIMPPSPHPTTGLPYTWTAEIDPVPLPNWLHEILTPTDPSARPTRATSSTTGGSITDYNAGGLAGILETHGWRCVAGDGDSDGSRWRHPTATAKISATVTGGRLYNYSTTTGLPLAGRHEGGMSPFDLLAHFEHAGNADSALASLGDTTRGAEKLIVVEPGDFDWNFPDHIAPDDPQPRPTEPAPAETIAHLRLTRASGMRMRASDWLWLHGQDHWIPLGGLVLLGGREGVGKSTWTARLVAQITNGKMHGEYLGQPKSVIVSATEDVWESTILPRLVAAGADLDRVLKLEAVEDGTTRGLRLPHDVAALRDAVRQEDVALVVLDPLLSCVGGNLDTHKDSDVRKALEPISLLAGEARATFLGLIHQNKSQGGDLLTRMMGSRAFSAVARAVLACAESDDAEDSESDTYLFGQLKNNLGPRVRQAVAYELVSATVGVDPHSGKPINTSKVDVKKDGEGAYVRMGDIEEIVIAAEAKARAAMDGRKTPGGNATERCARRISDLLAHGPVLGADVKVILRGESFSDSTVKKACAWLGDAFEVVGSYHNPEWKVS